MFLFGIQLSANAQGNWLRSIGSTSFEEMKDATFDSNGDYVMAGYFTNDLNTGVNTLSSAGNTDICVIKTDDAGDPIWAVQAGGTGVDRANGIASDAAGNTYITGYFQAAATFGTINVTGQGWEAYAAKIDVNGNFIWVTTFGGSFGDISHDVAVDNAGNVICTGEYKGTATFGATVLNSQLNSGGAPSYDVFTTKLDNNGNFIWTEDGKASYDDRGTGVTTDAAGNIYIVGQFSDTITFDNTHNSTLLNAGFVVSYDANGNEQWFSKAWGAQVLYTDVEWHNNKVFITGDFINNLFVEDINNIQNYAGPEEYNIFITRFDQSGDLDWLSSNYSANELHSTDIAVDASGNPYMTGDFKCTFTEMNDNYGNSTFLSVGYDDVHFIKYDNAGTFQWARQMASEEPDKANSVAIKTIDKPVICGTHEGDFHVPSGGSFTYDVGQQITLGTNNCGDANYNDFAHEATNGQQDIYWTSPFDINRLPMDYFEKDPALPCDLNTYGPCIGDEMVFAWCLDTLEGCDPVDAWLNDFFLDSPSPNFNVTWSHGGVGVNTTMSTQGTYTATLTTADGCYTWQDDIFILVHPDPDPPLISDSWGYNNQDYPASPIDTCDADSVYVWANSQNSPNDTLIWQGGQQTDSSLWVTNSGSYVVYAVNQFGCESDTTQIDIVINNFALDDTLDPKIVFANTDIMNTDSTISCGLPFCVSTYLIDSSFVNQWGTLPNLYSVWYVNGVFYDTLYHNSDDSTLLTFPSPIDICVTDTGWFEIAAELVHECADTMNYFLIDSFYVDSIPDPFLLLDGPLAACDGDTITVTAEYYTDTIYWNGANIIANFGDSVHVVYDGSTGININAVVDTTVKNTTCTTNLGYGISALVIPDVTIGPADGVICPGDSVTFTATSGIAWQWIGPGGDSLGTNQIQYATDVGEYFCYVTNMNGCEIATEFVSAVAYSSPTVFAQDPIICEGDSTFIQVLAPTNTIINWLPPFAGSQTFQWVDSAGWYYVETTFCGITKTDSVEVQFSPPIIDPNMFNDTTICPYDTLVLSAPPGMSLYEWNDVPGINTFEVTDTGDYWLYVEDPLGCIGESDTITVTYHTLPTPPVATDTSICPNTDATLFATGSGTIDWYQMNGTYLFTGSPYLVTSVPTSVSYLVTNSDLFCASESDTATITVFPNNIIADFTIADTCGSLTIQVQNSGSTGLDYAWDMGDATLLAGDTVNHTYAGNGTYTIWLVTTDLTCGFIDSISLDITVYGQSVDTIFNNPTCHLFDDGSLTLNVIDAVGGEIITIQDSLGNILNTGGTNTANNLAGGWYYYFVELGPGCILIDSANIQDPGPLDAVISIYPPLCFGGTGSAVVDTAFNWQGDYNNISFFWNPNPAQIGGVWADSSWNMTAGQYVLTVNDDNGCSNVIDFDMTEPPELVLNQLGYEPAYCRLFPYQSGNGVVFASATGGTPDYDYEWCMMFDTICTTNTTWGGLNPGWYQITVTDANGCVIVDSIEVDSLNPIADFDATSVDFSIDYEGDSPLDVHFENGSNYYANPNNPNADTTFYWNFNYDTAPWVISHDINDTYDTTYTSGEYTVCLVAVNKNGCSDTLCKKIIVYDPVHLDPVNVFTPDGDGVNDEFTFVYTQEGIDQFECLVVNRWGVTVREFYDVHDSWDGLDKNGDLCPDGVYFYVYKGVGFNSTEFSGQGTVTLITNRD